MRCTVQVTCLFFYSWGNLFVLQQLGKLSPLVLIGNAVIGNGRLGENSPDSLEILENSH